MTNEMKRKLAYTKLSNSYKKRYFRIVLYRVLLGLLEGAAFAVTCFLLASKINSNVIDGGPSAFFRMLGAAVGVSIFLFTLTDIPEIKEALKKQYRRAKLMIVMKFS